MKCLSVADVTAKANADIVPVQNQGKNVLIACQVERISVQMQLVQKTSMKSSCRLNNHG
jgi:hypothetical protein